MKLKLFKIIHIAFHLIRAPYLWEIGWINSNKSKRPMDKMNNPIPWWTYGIIDFLEEKNFHNLEVFEFGLGNSSLWLKNKGAKVTSVEYDEDYYQEFKEYRSPTFNIIKGKLGENYSNLINDEKGNFDIIIIDGRERNKCLNNSIKKLKPEGIIIFDDTEREEYKQSFKLLEDKGFKHLYFTGFSPGMFYNKQTSIFYKSNNLLNI